MFDTGFTGYAVVSEAAIQNLENFDGIKIKMTNRRTISPKCFRFGRGEPLQAYECIDVQLPNSGNGTISISAAIIDHPDTSIPLLIGRSFFTQCVCVGGLLFRYGFVDVG